jgi:hypothetical protein
VIELGAGLALLCLPSVAVALLLGTPLEAPVAMTVARIGGTALLALGAACGLARGDTQSRGARIDRRDGTLESGCSPSPWSCRHAVTSGRRRFVAGSHCAARDNGRLVHRESLEWRGKTASQ